MKILITHEHSGTIRDAFRAMGHEAYSCDLIPDDEGSPYHLQGDAIYHIRSRQWGLIGMHPDCTYLTVAGIHWNNRGRGWDSTNAALQHVRDCMVAASEYAKAWYLENPVSIISTKIMPPTQTIQPYQFGEDASKRTCLWLRNLPLLTPTVRVPGRRVEWPKGSGKVVERWANQTDSGQNRLGPSDNRWKLRAKTYPGIAKAMAEQWGGAS